MEDDQQQGSSTPMGMDTFQQFEKPPYKHQNHADKAFDMLSSLRRWALNMYFVLNVFIIICLILFKKLFIIK